MIEDQYIKHREKRLAQKREYYTRKKEEIKSKRRVVVYGMTTEEIDKLLESQGYVCAICRTDKPEGRGFSVDHDHTTGKVRGILCGKCNSMLGLGRDDPNILSAGAEYLRKGD